MTLAGSTANISGRGQQCTSLHSSTRQRDLKNNAPQAQTQDLIWERKTNSSKPYPTYQGENDDALNTQVFTQDRHVNPRNGLKRGRGRGWIKQPSQNGTLPQQTTSLPPPQPHLPSSPQHSRRQQHRQFQKKEFRESKTDWITPQRGPRYKQIIHPDD